MISINRLDKTFNRGKQNAIHVVNDISLELPASGMVAIFGRSGCGKTTLLNVIGGLDRVESGSVEIDGEKMTVSNDSLRNRSVGYIFQNYLLNREQTCYENVADALRLLGVTDRRFIETQVDAALRAVGMERFAQRLPDTLSGGQQQRIAIARAIVKNPPVILADEPTGNLDEQNTLHVMRLLKAISRDRLVLLVTHEENLVSAFSDRVIELSDGKVVSDRVNVPTEGFIGRDKNAVYLGELSHRTLLDGDGVQLDLYGDAPDVKLRLVKTTDGRVFLKVDSGKVSVLDESSEVRLENGPAPKAGEGQTDADDLPDLSAIKPIKGARPGRLFGFADAWKSGVRANLGQRKRGRKALRGALILFAAVVVFMTASLGVFVKKLSNVDGTYHHKIVYAYAGDERVADELMRLAADSGVLYRQMTLARPTNFRNYAFDIGDFETFSDGSGFYLRSSTTISADAGAFLRSLSNGRKLLAGRNTGLSDDDALISESVAKALLGSASVNYLTDYDDLIGIRSDSYSFRIAGVVSGTDREIFLSPTRLLDVNPIFEETALYTPARLGEIDPPADGTVSVVLPYEAASSAPAPTIGDVVFVNGKEMTVDRVIRGFGESYAAWCAARGYALNEYIDPTFAQAEAYLEHYSEYLLEKTGVFGAPDPETLIWRTGLYPDAIYWANSSDGTARPAQTVLAYRTLWRESHPGAGNPTEEEVRQWAEEAGDSGMSFLYEQKRDRFENDYYDLYWEFYYGNMGQKYLQYGYLLNENEAEAALTRCGKTTLLADSSYLTNEDGSDIARGGDERIPGGAYLILLSDDPDRLAAKIESMLGEYYQSISDNWHGFINENGAINTPAVFRQEALETERAEIVSNAIELAVFIAVMSLCMYLMMRASMMGRIREIGICRAIGVSKKNLVFRFFVESLAVTSLTVLVGYLLSSLLISAWLAKVPLIGEFFYYPLWMALAALGLLYAISALCGTLPVLRLLRKTPSEILSKYDI